MSSSVNRFSINLSLANCLISGFVFSIEGMVDIARQTVEFLYEENGGIPRDLYLPTIEDIKDEASKFTIEKVRKGKHTHKQYTRISNMGIRQTSYK